MLRRIATALLVASSISLALADGPEDSAERGRGKREFDYAILRNGDRIGHYRFDVSRKGDRRHVRVDMKTRVKIMFITVYRAEHQRTSEWKGGRLMRLDGASKYNGEPYDLKFRRENGAAKWTVDGDTRRIEGPCFAFVPWLMESGGEGVLLTEKGKMRRLERTRLGEETKTIDGRELELRHFVYRGDVTRHVWFDGEDRVALVAYQKNGDDIHMARRYDD